MLSSNTHKDEETVAFAKKEHSTLCFDLMTNDVFDNHQHLLSRTDRYCSFTFTV